MGTGFFRGAGKQPRGRAASCPLQQPIARPAGAACSSAIRLPVKTLDGHPVARWPQGQGSPPPCVRMAASACGPAS